MKPGRQWLHFDAHFLVDDFGRELGERYGAAGVLLFVAFLGACKRSFPQGQIRYASEEEARYLLGFPFPFIDSEGSKWALDDFWTFCRYRRVVSRYRKRGVVVVVACHWHDWEMLGRTYQDAERKRRSRAQKRPVGPGQTSGGTFKGVRNVSGASAAEGGGVRGEGGLSRGECEGTGTAGTARPLHPEIDQSREGDPQPPPKGGAPRPLAHALDEVLDRLKTTAPGPDPVPDEPDAPPADPTGRPGQDPLADRLAGAISGVDYQQALKVVTDLRHAGVGDVVIDEAIGKAADAGATSARYVQRVALDWMSQRDPTWRDDTDPWENGLSQNGAA